MPLKDCGPWALWLLCLRNTYSCLIVLRSDPWGGGGVLIIWKNLCEVILIRLWSSLDLGVGSIPPRWNFCYTMGGGVGWISAK